MAAERSTAELENFLAERADHLLVLQQTATISWLPATSRNLDKLTVPVPAGYRQVPLLEAVLLTLGQIQGLPSRGS